MRLRELANSGIRLPEIGFGTWNTAEASSRSRGNRMWARLIDTAESYGSEEIVGEAIKVGTSSVLATKCFLGFQAERLDCRSRKKPPATSTDHIDLYQLHWPNLAIPIEEPMRGMEELVAAGKSGSSSQQFLRARPGERAGGTSTQRIAANQVRYSLIERTIEGGCWNTARRRNTVIAYSRLRRAWQISGSGPRESSP